MNGLGEALGRLESRKGEPSQREEGGGGKPDGKTGGHKGHSGHIVRHSNGKHHVTVHDKGGQMVHHSEHGSWQEAANELGQHGAGGAASGETGEDSEPGMGM